VPQYRPARDWSEKKVLAESTPMVLVSLHYWAGARAAAGVETESIQTTSVAEALRQAQAARDPGFSRIIKACSLLVDGVAAHPADLDRVLTGPVRVDVLPPFAGGDACNCAHSAGKCASGPIVWTRSVTKITQQVVSDP
jgi:molybdopterin synthase sulfur carrier subunit